LNPNILVVEDDQVFVLLIQNYLSKNSYRFDHESTFAGALKRLGQNVYEAILLDLVLPDSFGLEVIRGIMELCQTTPIIVITGIEDYNLASEAIKIGVEDCLFKTNSLFSGHILDGIIKNSITRFERHKRMTQEFNKLKSLANIIETKMNC